MIAVDYSFVLVPLLATTSYIVIRSARNSLQRAHDAGHDPQREDRRRRDRGSLERDQADFHYDWGWTVLPRRADSADAGKRAPPTRAGTSQGFRPGFRLQGSPRRRRVRGGALLSPCDALVWERDRTERIFGFRYRIETTTGTFGQRFGVARNIDGTWKITRATICQDLSLAGGDCGGDVGMVTPPAD